MAKRRKRRSTADLTAKAMKDIRNMHRTHLREISAILTNVLGFPVKVTPVRAQEVLMPPRKTRKAKPTRATAHVAGYGTDLPPGHEAKAAPDLPDQEVGL